jgi:alpha-glucosidase (family GH31 glycosyl hydrolase)
VDFERHLVGTRHDRVRRGFSERDIPVGGVILDSPWETHYNTFVVNDARYPDFAGQVKRWRDAGIRTMLWTTQMVNESSFDFEPGGDTYEGESPNFAEAFDNGFFVNSGRTDFWWKGYGAGIDFFNDAAVRWWRNQQTPLLDAGVNGFKLDFGEQYLSEPVTTAAGAVPRQDYSEAYYRDFLAHGQATRAGGAEEFVTMVRPYDESYGFTPRFYARPEHAPIAWVGDQLQSWEGINDALDHSTRSFAAGYAVVGSDIGGYLNTDQGTPIRFDAEVFNRWTAMSGMMPFFQLHGRENVTPWTVPVNDASVVAATVANYRYWASLHHAMVPMWFSLTHAAQTRDAPMPMRPIGTDVAAWTGDWRMWIGDALVVAPFFAPGGTRSVVLPVTSDGAGFLNWWDLTAAPTAAGTTVTFTAPSLREMPVYVKEGAIIPLHIDNDATSFGNSSHAGMLTILAFPGPASTSFSLFDGKTDVARERTETTILLQMSIDLVTCTFTRTLQDTRVRIHTSLRTATVNGVAADAVVDGDAVWVLVPASPGPSVVRVSR